MSSIVPRSYPKSRKRKQPAPTTPGNTPDAVAQGIRDLMERQRAEREAGRIRFDQLTREHLVGCDLDPVSKRIMRALAAAGVRGFIPTAPDERVTRTELDALYAASEVNAGNALAQLAQAIVERIESEEK